MLAGAALGLSLNLSTVVVAGPPNHPQLTRSAGASMMVIYHSYNYGPKREYSVGSEKKPLVRYEPNHPRSKIRTPFMPKIEQNKVVDPSKTQSMTATPKIKSRQASDFNTTYRESYEQPSKAIRRQNRKI